MAIVMQKALWGCNCLKADYEKEGLGIQSGRVVEGGMAAWQDSCWCMNVCTVVALLSPSCPHNTQSMALQEVGGRHLVNEEQMDLIGHALYLIFSSQLPPSHSDFSILHCSWALPSPSFQLGENVCVLPIKSNEMLWSEPSAIPANAVKKWLNCSTLSFLGPLQCCAGPHLLCPLTTPVPRPIMTVGNKGHFCICHFFDRTCLITWEGLSQSPFFGIWQFTPLW